MSENLLPRKPAAPPSLRHTLQAQIDAARDGDRVQVMVTTTRQAGTKDAFRLTPPSGPDELCIGWSGLAHFFQSIEAADTICYLTAMRCFMYPDNPEKWTTVAKNFVVRREPNPGDTRQPAAPAQILPPTPPVSGLFVPPSPKELEDFLTGKSN